MRSDRPEAGIPVRMIEDNQSRGHVPARLLPAPNVRPSCGRIPRPSKKLSVTTRTLRRSSSSPDAAVHRRRSETDDIGERAAVAKVAVILIGELTAVSRLDADDLGRVCHGRLMPEDRHDPGVQRQVEADSETERQDADGHEPRRPAKTADAVSKILGESSRPGRALVDETVA